MISYFNESQDIQLYHARNYSVDPFSELNGIGHELKHWRCGGEEVRICGRPHRGRFRCDSVLFAAAIFGETNERKQMVRSDCQQWGVRHQWYVLLARTLCIFCTGDDILTNLFLVYKIYNQNLDLSGRFGFSAVIDLDQVHFQADLSLGVCGDLNN